MNKKLRNPIKNKPLFIVLITVCMVSVILFCLIFFRNFNDNKAVSSEAADSEINSLNEDDIDECFEIGKKLLTDFYYAKDCGGGCSLEGIIDNEALSEYIGASIKVNLYIRNSHVVRLLGYASSFKPTEWTIKDGAIRLGIAVRIWFTYERSTSVSGFGEPVYLVFRKDDDGNIKMTDLYIESIDAAYRGAADNYNEKLWITPELYKKVLEKINKAVEDIESE